MDKKKENKDKYFTLKGIRDDYFNSCEIETIIWKSLYKERLFIVYGVLPIFFTFYIPFIVIPINAKIELRLIFLLIIGSILIIGDIVLFKFYLKLKFCGLLKSYKKLKKEIAKEEKSRCSQKYLKLDMKGINSLIKENIDEQAEYKVFYTILFSNITYWLTFVFIIVFDVGTNSHFIFWIQRIVPLALFIIIMVLFTLYSKYKVFIYVKEKSEIKFWELYKYKKLKKEIKKKNQDKFFEDRLELKEIKVIDYLIEVYEKEIMNNDKEINKKNNFFIYQTLMITVITWIMNKSDDLDKIFLLLIMFLLSLKVIKKVYNFYIKNICEQYFTTIRENNEFIHLLKERKFELLQQKHLPYETMRKKEEEVIANK